MKIANTAAAILASYFAEGKHPEAKIADKRTFYKKEALYEAVRTKFVLDNDDYALNALQHLAELPEDKECKATLADILATKSETDPKFAQKLARLVLTTVNKMGLVRVSTKDGYKTRQLSLPKEPHKEFLDAQKLMRYPSLDCPDKTIRNQRFSVFVRLFIEPPKPDATAIIVEDMGIPEQLPEVEVVISARGFDIEGSNTKVLKVDRENDSEERFILIPRIPGEQQMRVDFYQYGRRIGTVRRNVLITTEPVKGKVEQTGASVVLELKSAPIAPPPDLELCVELDKDERTLNFRLHSTKESVGYNHAKFGQMTLKRSPSEMMQSVYHEMSEMARQPGVDAEQRTAAIGRNLWDKLFPDKLKREYWYFKSRVTSILITSDEPWVPWEMMKPYRYKANNEREEDPFLCQQFFLSRWLSGPGAVELFHGGIAQPIAPTQVNLAAVHEEVTFIEQLSQLDSRIIGQAPLGDRSQVLDLIEKGEFFILHFASHAGFDATLPDNSAITLSNGPLRPSDIQVRFGDRRPRPLIFMNACEGAQMDFSFTGLGGWADKLVNEAHVGAFVGAMWEVNDVLALRFARHFYTALLRDKHTIAQSFQMARKAIQNDDPSNSTWLAYVLYADPEGRIKEQGNSIT